MLSSVTNTRSFIDSIHFALSCSYYGALLLFRSRFDVYISLSLSSKDHLVTLYLLKSYHRLAPSSQPWIVKPRNLPPSCPFPTNSSYIFSNTFSLHHPKKMANAALGPHSKEPTPQPSSAPTVTSIRSAYPFSAKATASSSASTAQVWNSTAQSDTARLGATQ